MAGSGFGTIFRVTTWGESHGPALGAVVDGCPAGLALSETDIQEYLDRRRPNGGAMSTKRNEADRVEILSGLFEGRTTGTPISMVIRNTDQRSRDYSNIKDVYRPGHADYGFDAKYGFRDYRGGGRSSGRETIGRVAGGAIACKLLKELGITLETKVVSIGGLPYQMFADSFPEGTSPEEASETQRLRAAAVESLLLEARAAGDSLGSEVECRVYGMPTGIGDPVFEKLDANLGKALFSIGAVKSVDIGDGSAVAAAKGSENNDAFRMTPDGRIATKTNHAGGILGGFSDGSVIRLRAYFKPTPSISIPQETVDSAHENAEITIHGRHDPVIGPRASVVVECMTALVLVDALLLNMSARLDSIAAFYNAL